MAKETKAQRETREQAEMEYFREVEVTTYLQRLMDVMERACKHNFDLTVKNGKFFLYDRDLPDYMDQEGLFWLASTHSVADNDILEKLEFRVSFKAKEKEEANRILQLKRSALAKLSKEERNALGME